MFSLKSLGPDPSRMNLVHADWALELEDEKSRKKLGSMLILADCGMVCFSI